MKGQRPRRQRPARSSPDTSSPRPGRVVRFAERLVEAPHPGQVPHDIGERDRLRLRRHPPGQIIAGKRSTSATIVSKAALPPPTTTAERTIVTGTGPADRPLAVFAGLRRCADNPSRSSPRPPRKTSGEPRPGRRLRRPILRPAVRAPRSPSRRASRRGGRRRRSRTSAGSSSERWVASAATPRRGPRRGPRTPRHGDDLMLAGERGHEPRPMTPLAPGQRPHRRASLTRRATYLRPTAR